MRGNNDIEEKLEKLAQAIEADGSLVDSVTKRIEAKPPLTPNVKAVSRPIIRTLIKRRLTKLAAAAAVLIVAILAVKSLDGTEAWAQVVQAFNRVNNIHIVKTRVSNSGRVIEESESWVRNQRLFRAESEDWCIVNDGKNLLTLYKEHKIANLRDSITPYWDYTPVILKVLQEVPGERTVVADIMVAQLPDESTPTKRAFAITDYGGKWQGKAWVDASNNLPLRIVGASIEDEAASEKFELTFDYEQIDEQIFRVTVPPDYRELPRLVRREVRYENDVLFGIVIDEQGTPVVGADVYASYAGHDKTDANGAFSLSVPPEDGSNSLGPADFPMFVRAFNINDPYKVAWTIIRHPKSADNMRYYSGWELSELSSEAAIELPPEEERRQRDESAGQPVVERTHQGVKLVIEDADELTKMIPGDPGKMFNDIDDNPMVQNIVLMMGPASVIRGRVTDKAGSPVADATIWVGELEMSLGKNKLYIESLGGEWRHKTSAVTNQDGSYEIANLPASWDKVKLEAKDPEGLVGNEQYQSKAGKVTEGCDITLAEGEAQMPPEDDNNHYRLYGRPRLSKIPVRIERDEQPNTPPRTM